MSLNFLTGAFDEGEKKLNVDKRKIKLCQTKYIQVISGYFINIKEPLVSVFCGSFAF